MHVAALCQMMMLFRSSLSEAVRKPFVSEFCHVLY
jgi:hypothetical protein